MKRENCGEYHPPQEGNREEESSKKEDLLEQRMDENELIEKTGSIQTQNAKHLIYFIFAICKHIKNSISLSTDTKS